eukprot:s2458_g9.t1
MPPKVRRPAAKAPAVRRRGEPRGVRRRPARAEEEPGLGGLGEEIDCAQISLEQCQRLREVEVISGSYWDAPIKAALRVREVRMKEEKLMLLAQVLGTQSEDLLKWASGQGDQIVRVHLCPKECPGTPHEDGLLHVKRLRPLGEIREDWMSNLVPQERRRTGEDELAELRADQDRHPPRGEEDVQRAEQVSESPPGRRKDKKVKKRSRSRKGRGAKPKLQPTKELGVIFGGTGADPDPKVRRFFRKKAAKLAKRKAKDSSSGSSGDPTSSSSSLSGDRALFGSANRVHTIGRKYPGVLLSAALEEASESLITQEGGAFNTQGGALPPLFTRYFRQQLMGRMSPAMKREAQTLAFLLDLALRGRVTESLDVAAQRLKSLEMIAAGSHFTVTQQTELLPKDDSSLATLPEFTEAARRAREDGRARLDASRPYGARGSGGGRSEEWNKGTGKKGASKGKGAKNDQRKGESDKAEGKKAKGG